MVPDTLCKDACEARKCTAERVDFWLFAITDSYISQVSQHLEEPFLVSQQALCCE